MQNNIIKKPDIMNLSLNQLALWLNKHGIEAYRALQIFKWIYMNQVDSFEVMTNLSKDIRKLLSSYFSINRLVVSQTITAHSGTKKYLFKLVDNQFIESVLIPKNNRYTLCISSQVGCAQGCLFCLTARCGFKRNLTSAEIIAQVRDIIKIFYNTNCISNIVFMGMGEPLANYDNVIKAIKIVTNSDFGLNFSSRRVTLSTAGIVPKLFELSNDTTINLAISLNATNNKLRNRLMPINRKYPIEQLLDACWKCNLKPRQRITFEYILIKGVNDSKENAVELAKLLKNKKSKINLIPFNEHHGINFKRSVESSIFQFQKILHEYNYTAIIRQSKGDDILAACGQLSANAF